MFDDFTKERLRTLTIEEIEPALKYFASLISKAEEQKFSIEVNDCPWISMLKILFANIPNTIEPDQNYCVQVNPPAIFFIEEHNTALYDWLVTKEVLTKHYGVEILNRCFNSLRKLFDDVVHIPECAPKEVPATMNKFLQAIVIPNRPLLRFIEKDSDIEGYIYGILKEIKALYPKLYKQYQALYPQNKVDTPLMQVVKKTVSARYFSGNIGSFCPIFIADILNSPQFKAMSTHPKHQLILLDMIDLCNYLDGSRKGCSIETNGFHYTWSDCRIEISEDAFRWALKDIVSRGWFKVIGKAKLDDGPAAIMYTPSTDWKKKRLAEKEISRIQNYGEQKRQRIADSKERYRRSKADVECGVEHTFSDI